jgi:hypothetical protein
MWWLTQTNGTHIRESWWFESMYTMHGKTRYTWHVRFPHQSTYTSCGQSMYVATFHESSKNLDGSHCSWEKGPPTQFTAHRLTKPRVRTQFLSQANQWSSRLKPSFCQWQAIRLIGPISPTCDWYVQYLLTGVNPSVLNRHRRGLQPWRCQLATYHSPTFPTDGLHFSPKSPARSPV